MRTLKFRAWDKYSKPNKMVYPHDGDFIGWHSPSNWKECYEVMQFTGLLDKNGKEIFEGDIIKTGGDHLFADETWIVGFEHGAFGFKNNLHEKSCSFIYFALQLFWNEKIRSVDELPRFIEVIGNIYETPNLLEK